MKIGIDARFLTHPQPGGFKTYTVNLIHALGRVDQINRYVIYLDRLPSENTLPQKNNFIYQVVDGTLPGLGMPIREQFKLRSRIDRDKPDLVHFLCNTATLGISNKFIVTLHDIIQVSNRQTFKVTRSLGNYRRWAKTAYSKWAILKTAQAARRIITVSTYEKSQIIQHMNVNPWRVSVTYLAPNPVFSLADSETRESWRTVIRRKYGLSRKYILGVGYEPRKNIPLLIESFARLMPTHPDLDLVIVAAQEDARLVFQQLVTKWNINDRVAILADLLPSELAMLYNMAQVFVFPSERESFGLPPLEALACGTPTIAMNVTSLPEILGDGAILIDGKDLETWANAIDKVLTDDNLRKDLVGRGLKQATKLTWQQCAEKTLEIYRDVAEKS